MSNFNEVARMIAFLFPGQGSQRRGMAQGLFDQREYAVVEAAVDSLLGYSMRALCLEDSGNKLNETQYTQPSLYVANALHYYEAIDRGTRPSLVAGHSLGEYNALLAAGAFDFLTGLRLVKKRGELMAQARNGGMAAVIGLTASRTEQVIRENGLGSIDVANYNAPSQTVISGPADDINGARASFEKAGAMFFPLRVSAAFHSRYMAESANAYAEFLAPFEFNVLSIPVIANATGQPYPKENPTDTIKSLLVKQIRQPVLWTETIRYMKREGVTEFRETGPGNVLTRLVQQIQQSNEA